MQLPLSWLKSLFPHEIDIKTIDDTLTKAGIEVDLIEPFLPPFEGVIVAKVIEASPHPDAQKLQVAKVFDGTHHYQVVCGAKNCRKDLIVAFAKPGAVLGDKDPFVIQEKALRGVNSQGMLAGADELGLTLEKESGVMELDESFPLGADLKTLLSDHILHISVTPNLGHTLSVLGIARELSAFLQKPYVQPKGTVTMASQVETLPIKIDSNQCPSYHAYRLSHVKMTQSPFLIQHRLRLAGFNTKNLVVDILNYVMFEQGQPMHSFDANKLTEGSLHVVNLTHPESFKALNGKSYTMEKGLLAIKSGSHVAACAGVMGSEDTASTLETTSVVLESAWFTPQSARRAIKALDLRSDAAGRFEKGIDPAGLVKSLDYATSLIQYYTGCSVTGSFHHITQPKAHTIELKVDKTNRLLGTSLCGTEMSELLKRLEMQVHTSNSSVLHVTRPSYRNDINIEEDLIEEIGRLYGLDHLKGHLNYQASTLIDHPFYTFEKPLKKALFSQGLQEVLTCDLLSLKLCQDFKLDKQTFEPISVLHPRSQDQCTLRMSLLSSFIPVIKKNLFAKENNLNLFEVGKIHAKHAGKFFETLQAGIILTGLRAPYYFNPKPQEFDFYDLKGMVENILEDLSIHGYDITITHDSTFHPYQQMSIKKDDELLCKLGQVHPELLKDYDIDQKVYYAELSVAELMKFSHLNYPIALAPSQPYIERDWTLPMAESSEYEELLEAIVSNKPKHFESVNLLDIYPHNGIKNITLRFRYRDSEKTLESSYIDHIHQNFITDVAKKLGLSL
jgi:phenylalanyl-tRNA synthetase beta chain